MLDIRNLTSRISDYEDGTMEDHDDIVALFQELLDTGIINHLQGSYQRTALRLLTLGFVKAKNDDE